MSEDYVRNNLDMSKFYASRAEPAEKLIQTDDNMIL